MIVQADTEGTNTNTTAEAPAAPRATTFADLGLKPEVLQAVTEMGFTEPMEVQAVTLPLARAGRDVMVQSRTGSGKTAAFGIPFADSLADANQKCVQALVLLPTRELALQVAAEITRICVHTELAVVPIYGGAPMGRQIEQLRAGAQIVCGTPGRILDHLRRGTLQLDALKCAVLDECDEMLSMGFQEDIEAILEHTPQEKRQTLLFSATMPEGIQRIARRFMRNPELVKLSADFVGVHQIRHTYYSIPAGQREAELMRVLAFENPERAIIFCNTREETSRVAEFLRKQGLDAEAISSDLSQSERERVMTRMRTHGIRFLVATDVAARGIDLENLPFVINYTFPESPEVYIHRTGRTGRAGRSGHAISLIGPTEVGSFYYLKLLYKIRPEERTLPSEAEVRSKREGESLIALREQLPTDPGPEWRSLARRLMGATDGERLVGALLRGALGKIGKQPQGEVPPPRPVSDTSGEASAPAQTETRPISSERERSRERGMRDSRGRRGGSERERPSRERPGTDRPSGERERAPVERAPVERPSVERTPERGPSAERPMETERTTSGKGPDRSRSGEARTGGGSRRGTPADEPREFWEVWSEEVGRTPVAPTGQTPQVAEPVAKQSNASATSVRLYISIGRKDGASNADVATVLANAGFTVPPSDIDTMNTHSYVNVPATDGDRLCAVMAGRQYNGRSIVCETARPPRGR
jgi:ATP-dependent RNA helicase DeaD